MNETNDNLCRCNPCAGPSCTCGCRATTAAAACACGPRCECGPGCTCGNTRAERRTS